MPRTPKWPIPQDFDPEQDQWRLVLFCIPDSREWRALVRGHIENFGYGRNWDEKTGSILAVQEIGRDIFESMDMTCGEDIKRIADVLEKWYDSQFVNLDDLIEVLPAGKFANWLDILGEYSEALNFLTPGFNLQLPKTDIFAQIGNFIFRKRVVEGINDISLQLKSLNTATAGPGAKTIIDELIQLLPQDELIDWVLGDLDEAVSSISDDLLTLLTGNYVTNRLDDIRNSVNGGGLFSGNVVDGLNDLHAILKECCERDHQVNITINQEQPHGGEISVGQPGDQFPDQPTYLDAKCASANAIFDTVSGFIVDILDSDLEEILSGSVGGVIPVLSYKLANAGVLGWAISKVSAFVTGIAIKLVGSVEINFGDIADALSEQHADLVCVMYNASDTIAAKNMFMATLALATTQLSEVETDVVSDLLTYDLLNQLFAPRGDAASYQPTINCAACGGDPCQPDFVDEGDGFVRGTGNLTLNDLERTLYSVEHPSNGFHYVSFNVGGATIDPDDCAGAFSECGSDDHFDIAIVSYSETPDDANSQACSGGSAQGGPFSDSPTPDPDTYYTVSWLEFIHDASFSMVVKLRDTP